MSRGCEYHTYQLGSRNFGGLKEGGAGARGASYGKFNGGLLLLNIEFNS